MNARRKNTLISGITIAIAMTLAGGCNWYNDPDDEDGSLTTYTVTPKSGENGEIYPSALQQVDDGEVISFRITPDDGYVIGKVIGCGGVLERDSYTTSPIMADCTVEARFDASDDGDINTDNAKKILDAGLVSLIVAQTSSSRMFMDHLVDGPTNRSRPELRLNVGDDVLCDDPDLRFPDRNLNNGAAYLIEPNGLIRRQANDPWDIPLGTRIRLNRFGGSPFCDLGAGNPGTLSNLLDGGPAPGPNVGIAITSAGNDWLEIEKIAILIEGITYEGYLHTFNNLPMIVNLSRPQDVLILSGQAETSPLPWVDLVIEWVNTESERDTIQIKRIPPVYYAPPYTETAVGRLEFDMDSAILERSFLVRIPQRLEIEAKPPTETRGAYLLTDYEDRKIMTVVSKSDQSQVALFCEELLKIDATTGLYCSKLQYRVNDGEPETYVLP
jgi:hypothetical protein